MAGDGTSTCGARPSSPTALAIRQPRPSPVQGARDAAHRPPGGRVLGLAVGGPSPEPDGPSARRRLLARAERLASNAPDPRRRPLRRGGHRIPSRRASGPPAHPGLCGSRRAARIRVDRARSATGRAGRRACRPSPDRLNAMNSARWSPRCSAVSTRPRRPAPRTGPAGSSSSPAPVRGSAPASTSRGGHAAGLSGAGRRPRRLGGAGVDRVLGAQASTVADAGDRGRERCRVGRGPGARPGLRRAGRSRVGSVQRRLRAARALGLRHRGELVPPAPRSARRARWELMLTGRLIDAGRGGADRLAGPSACPTAASSTPRSQTADADPRRTARSACA